MCDELTAKDAEEFLRRNAMTRREFSKRGAGATLAMMLPPVANALDVAEQDVVRINALGRFETVTTAAKPLPDGSVEVIYRVIEQPAICSSVDINTPRRLRSSRWTWAWSPGCQSAHGLGLRQLQVRDNIQRHYSNVPSACVHRRDLNSRAWVTKAPNRVVCSLYVSATV